MDVNVRDLNLTMESLTLTLTFLRFPKKIVKHIILKNNENGEDKIATMHYHDVP